MREGAAVKVYTRDRSGAGQIYEVRNLDGPGPLTIHVVYPRLLPFHNLLTATVRRRLSPYGRKGQKVVKRAQEQEFARERVRAREDVLLRWQRDPAVMVALEKCRAALNGVAMDPVALDVLRADLDALTGHVEGA